MATAPTPSGTQPAVVIALDVADLDKSQAYYERMLGMRVVAVERQGMILESREMTGSWHPGVALHLRKQFGIRVSGSHPGTLLRISLHTPDLVARRGGLRQAGAKWMGPEPPADAASVLIIDPDGYEIELFTRRGPLVVPPPPTSG